MTRRDPLERAMMWLAGHTGWSVTIIVGTIALYVAVFALALAGP